MSQRNVSRSWCPSVLSVPLWPKNRILCALCAPVAAFLCVSVAAETPGKDATRWVEKTLASLTLDEKIGQLVVPSFESTYLPSDSDEYARLADLVSSRHVGGFIVFGGTEPAPPVLLNPTYGTVILGQPLEAAATLNRLQRLSKLPLLNAADFEFGVGMRISGGTQFPHAMALGATDDPALAEQAARIIGEEARALGIHMDFAPVADVNNNPRNPVINTRSFGEDPVKVGAMVAAFTRGLRAGGALATLKHFPGHGDTDVDTHLGLAVIPHDRDRLDALEFVPFKAGIAAGADAVMVAHVELPKIDPANQPATFSRPTTTGLLRDSLKFNGLIVTDSMSMAAIAKLAAPGDGAARAIEAGADIVLQSPDSGSRDIGDRRGGGPGRHRGGADRRLCATRPRRKGAARPADDAAGGPGGGHRARREPRAPRGGAGGQRAVDDAREGRAPAGAADAGEGEVGAAGLGARLPGRLAHRVARTDVPARAEGALAEQHGDRNLGPDDGLGARSRADDGREVRRDRAGDLRAHSVRQRPYGSGAGYGEALSLRSPRSAAPTVRSSRRSSATPTWPRTSATCPRCC